MPPEDKARAPRRGERRFALGSSSSRHGPPAELVRDLFPRRSSSRSTAGARSSLRARQPHRGERDRRREREPDELGGQADACGLADDRHRAALALPAPARRSKPYLQWTSRCSTRASSPQQREHGVVVAGVRRRADAGARAPRVRSSSRTRCGVGASEWSRRTSTPWGLELAGGLRLDARHLRWAAHEADIDALEDPGDVSPTGRTRVVRPRRRQDAQRSPPAAAARCRSRRSRRTPPRPAHLAGAEGADAAPQLVRVGDQRRAAGEQELPASVSSKLCVVRRSALCRAPARLAHLPAERRLGDVQPLGRPGEVALARHRQEVVEPAQVRHRLSPAVAPRPGAGSPPVRARTRPRSAPALRTPRPPGRATHPRGCRRTPPGRADGPPRPPA